MWVLQDLRNTISCLYKEQNTKTTQVDIYLKRVGCYLGRSAINDILKEKSKRLPLAEDSSDLLRGKSAKHASVEIAFYTNFSDIKASSLFVIKKTGFMVGMV